MKPIHLGICETCKVPHIWAKDSVLDSDNTSLHRVIPMRGVFYEADEVRALIEGLERSLGIELDDMVVAAHGRAIRRFFEGTLKGLLGSVVVTTHPLYVYRLQAKSAPYFGAGLFRIISYARGGPLVVEVENVWDERLTKAETIGAFEAVEGVDADAETERDGDRCVFTVKPLEKEREEYRGRLAPLVGKLLASDEYPRCQKCGAPVLFQAFTWDTKRGETRERDNDLRVVHQTIASMDSLLHELEEEIGGEVREMAIRAQADHVRDMVQRGAYDALAGADDEPGRRFFRYLGLIRRRCMGNPIFLDYEPGTLKVKIRNPANEELLVGRVLGTFEAVTGVAGAAVADHAEGTLRVTVTPA